MTSILVVLNAVPTMGTALQTKLHCNTVYRDWGKYLSKDLCMAKQ